MKIKRILSTLILAIMTTLMLATSVFAASNSRQYVMVSYLDPTMGGVETVIVESDSKTSAENSYSLLNDSGAEFYLKSGNMWVDASGNRIGTVALGQEKQKKYYPYSWTGTNGSDLVSATSSDGAQATFIAGILTESMNNIMSFILSEADITGELTAKETNDLMNAIPACKVGGSCKITLKKKEIVLKIKTATEEEFKRNKINSNRIANQSKNDYISVSVNGGKSIVSLWSAEKGYSSGQYLAGLHDTSSNSWQYNVKKLSLSHIAYSANYQYANIPSQTIEDYYSDGGMVENGITSLLMGLVYSVVNSIKSGFNLYSIEDLMLGSGVRDIRYFLGIMPSSWFDGATFLCFVSMAIAIGIIGFGILRLVLQMNKAAINSQARVDYKEGIEKLFATIAILALFYPMFTLLANVNNWIVEGLATIPTNLDGMSNLMTQPGNTWAGLIISVCYLATLIKINVTYIIRAVTVGLLFAFGPLFIATLSTQEKAPIFWTWLKELIGNLFMQSIHAMVLVFYLLIISVTRMTGIEKVVIVMSLIPLTTFFKNTLLMLSSGTDKASESVGAKLFGAASFAMGAAAIIPGTAVNVGAKGFQLGGKGLEKLAKNEEFRNFAGDKVSDGIGKIGKGANFLGDAALDMEIGNKMTGLTAAGLTMAGSTQEGFSAQGVNAFRKEAEFHRPRKTKEDKEAAKEVVKEIKEETPEIQNENIQNEQSIITSSAAQTAHSTMPSIVKNGYNQTTPAPINPKINPNNVIDAEWTEKDVETPDE